MLKQSLFLFLLMFPSILTFTQNDPVTITLNSSVLKEPRKVMIYVPEQSMKKQTYPVVYVLDAESLFPYTISANKFMHFSSSLPQMPEAIVVGILNTNRNRDMPVPQEMSATNGAKNFLDFIASELSPYINQQYPANGLNVLIGHSQGGLFATYAGLEQPGLFPFILSLDAPMTVNEALLKQYKQKLIASCRLNYFSAETKFGWRNDFSPGANCNSYVQGRIEGETHETMPYKGIYDGLKFLFREYIPPQQDVPLTALQEYYNGLSKKYNCNYEIPAPVLLAAARQNVNQSKKDYAVDIINYYNEKYGENSQSAELFIKANAITKGPDERVSFYLKHPSASEIELKPFMGKWKGVLHVPGGEDMSMVCEIRKVNDKYVWFARVMNQFDDISAFLVVKGQKELAWGRKHDSGGIYLSTAQLSADGQKLTGSEVMVGVNFPEGMAPHMPNTFEFTRVK